MKLNLSIGTLVALTVSSLAYVSTYARSSDFLIRIANEDGGGGGSGGEKEKDKDKGSFKLLQVADGTSGGGGGGEKEEGKKKGGTTYVC